MSAGSDPLNFKWKWEHANHGVLNWAAFDARRDALRRAGLPDPWNRVSTATIRNLLAWFFRHADEHGEGIRYDKRRIMAQCGMRDSATKSAYRATREIGLILQTEAPRPPRNGNGGRLAGVRLVLNVGPLEEWCLLPPYSLALPQDVRKAFGAVYSPDVEDGDGSGYTERIWARSRPDSSSGSTVGSTADSSSGSTVGSSAGPLVDPALETLPWRPRHGDPVMETSSCRPRHGDLVL